MEGVGAILGLSWGHLWRFRDSEIRRFGDAGIRRFRDPEIQRFGFRSERAHAELSGSGERRAVLSTEREA